MLDRIKMILAVTLLTLSSSLIAVDADPGHLVNYRPYVGQFFSFQITGSADGSVWGSGIYTDDSRLAKAAVHAGLLSIGQTGIVTAQILPGQGSYASTTQNGITTASWGSWPGSYQFVHTDYAFINLSGDLTFGNTGLNRTKTASLTIYNSGNIAIMVTSISYPNPVFSGSFSGTINPGQSQVVTVTFAPTQIGSYSGTVTVNSNAYGVNTAGIFGECLLPDFNNDMAVNPADLMIFTNNWLHQGPPTLCDINSNGIVDMVDFAMMADYWLFDLE